MIPALADTKLKGLLLYGDSFVYINTVNLSQILYHSHMVCRLYLLLAFDFTNLVTFGNAIALLFVCRLPIRS